jgi:L-ascorbate metabolism protein UlaG (beta-lactamase superfamily)
VYRVCVDNIKLGNGSDCGWCQTCSGRVRKFRRARRAGARKLACVNVAAQALKIQSACYHATRGWLKPKFAIPMHYGTILQLKGTLVEYVEALRKTLAKVFVMNPGDKLEF